MTLLITAAIALLIVGGLLTVAGLVLVYGVPWGMRLLQKLATRDPGYKWFKDE